MPRVSAKRHSFVLGKAEEYIKEAEEFVSQQNALLSCRVDGKTEALCLEELNKSLTADGQKNLLDTKIGVEWKETVPELIARANEIDDYLVLVDKLNECADEFDPTRKCPGLLDQVADARKNIGNQFWLYQRRRYEAPAKQTPEQAKRDRNRFVYFAERDV